MMGAVRKLLALGRTYGPAFLAFAILVELIEDLAVPALCIACGKAWLAPFALALHVEPLAFPLWFLAAALIRRARRFGRDGHRGRPPAAARGPRRERPRERARQKPTTRRGHGGCIDHIVLLVLNGSLGNRSDPYGPRLVAAAVEAEGVRVVMHQERLRGRAGLLTELARRGPAMAILISAVPGTRGLAEFVRSIARAVGAHTPIVLGGVGARRLDLAVVDVDNPVVVVHGMGEVAAAAITRMLRRRRALDPGQLSKIPNLTFSINGRTERSEDSLDTDVLDLVPSTTGLAEAIRRGDTISACTSAGCNGTCTFCAIRDVERTSCWRRRPCAVLDQWLREIVLAGGRSVCVDIIDDSLATAIDHLEDVAETFARVNAQTGATLTWRASTRCDHVVDRRDTEPERSRRRAIWRYAVKAGLESLFLGVESGSAAQLRRFGKRTTPAVNAAALDELRDLGIRVEVGFIALIPSCPRVPGGTRCATTSPWRCVATAQRLVRRGSARSAFSPGHRSPRPSRRRACFARRSLAPASSPTSISRARWRSSSRRSAPRSAPTTVPSVT